ncbi:TIM barrel protein [Methanosarcina sp. 1.H.T.1A.1]|uniref:TIM barrel protein n=1 Tax=Methanosarcina sp. 1.H.T.1A.1 TaxID=1483602 RepID=UPI000A79B180|nr:TIM barrel protein [Methanosarcina sp. 1.H.T.1A.1]
MKFGLKLWSTNQDTLPQADQLIKDNVFQYIELTPIPCTEIDSFLSYDLPYTIHITTERHGLNIADRHKRDFNLELINNSLSWADQLNSEFLVLHPGFGEIEDTIEFLDLINDSRILIENMPSVGLNYEKMVGYSPEQIRELIGSRFGFCLDLNHAVKAALGLGIDYKPFVMDFFSLNPSYFHISDGFLTNCLDEHLSIGNGEYDFDFLINCLYFGEDNHITLETPRINLMSFDEDLYNLGRLYSLF